MDKCAFDLGKKCYALTVKDCVCCHFRKTEEELEKGRRKARMRIATLPTEQRDYIKKQYSGY